MGPRGGAQGAIHVDETVYAEARAHAPQGRPPHRATPRRRRDTTPWRSRRCSTLDLDASATETTIKARYKELVKRQHPDANGGDRSSEEKLREIIQAYNLLEQLVCRSSAV